MSLATRWRHRRLHSEQRRQEADDDIEAASQLRRRSRVGRWVSRLLHRRFPDFDHGRAAFSRRNHLLEMWRRREEEKIIGENPDLGKPSRLAVVHAATGLRILFFSADLIYIFRCDFASLKEVVSVRPSVRRSVGS